MSMIDKIHLRVKCTVAFRESTVVLAVEVMGRRRILKIPNQRKNSSKG